MRDLSSANAFHIEGMIFSRDNVSGFGIPEYTLPAIKDKNKSSWSYQKIDAIKPEDLITKLIEANGYEVMGEEGRLIKQLYNLLCLVAYEEHENGPMITETGSKKVVSLRPCFMTFPSAPFTLNYIKKLLTISSIDEIIDYIDIFGPLSQGFDENELDLIHSFLSSFTLEKLLSMFELALSNNSGISGWPDITAMKNNSVYFIEVKTTDSLTKQQKYWLSTYKHLLDIDYRIIRLN